MINRKRSDTRIDTIEEQYGIDLNSRGDALLGNLLEERGFVSLSQLLSAYRGQLTSPAATRRIFLSFHEEDKAQVAGFRLMLRNPKLNFDVYDGSLQAAVRSENGSYIRQVIYDKLRRCSVVVCLIGNGTAWREWVDWELETGFDLGKGLCGIRLKDSRGKTPPLLKEIGAPIASWDIQEAIAAIECAAARRS